MGTVTLPNFRITADVHMNTGLKDGGVAIDWASLTNIKAWLYSDAQKAIAGPCDVTIDEEDSTVLKCLYPASRAQYLGVNRLIVQARYMGSVKTYDKPVFNFVPRTAEATGSITIDDPEVDVTIEVTDTTSSILDNAIAAAIAAAADAERAASLMPYEILDRCMEATGNANDAAADAYTAAAKPPRIGENGNWWTWDTAQRAYVDTGEVAQGETGNGIQSVVQTQTSQESGGENVVTVTMNDGTTAQFSVRNGQQGQQGIQGVPGVANAKYKEVETLPTASADTMDYIYLTPSGTSGVYNMSYTEQNGNTFTWKDLGTTAIQLSDYATKTEVNQLSQILGQISEGTTVISPNLFDKTARTEGKYVDKTSGALKTSTNWDVSDYIDVSSLAPATSMYVSMASSYSGNIGVAYYNSSKVFTHGGTKPTQTQAGDAYVRVSINKSDINTAMFIVGTSADVPSEYMPYGTIYSYEAIVPEDSVDTVNLKNNAVTGPKLAAGAAAGNLVTSTEKDISFNMIDFSSLEAGTYINSSGGVSTVDTSTYRASNFIPLNGKKVFYGIGMGSYGDATNGAAVYDADKNFIRAFRPGTSGNYDPASDPGAAYIRITLTGSYTLYYVCYADADGNNPMTPSSGTVTADINYFREQVVKKSTPGIVFDKSVLPALLPAYSLAGYDGFSKSFDSIAANGNESLGATEYPAYIKTVHTISFKAMSIDTMGDDDYVRVGLGYNGGASKAAKITTSKIIIQRYDSGYVNSLSLDHGLTISDFLMLELSFGWKGGTLRLVSRDGVFVQEFLYSQYSYSGNAQETSGRAFVETTVALTGVKLAQDSDRFRKPIWFVGDSYTTMASARWPWQLVNTMGVDNFLIAGYAGAPSEVMEPQLELMLQFGTPKYLVWCLGMNDQSAIWLNYAKKIEMICRDKGITLIYQTIPKNNDNKNEINLYIRNSGYRYIDFVSAVMRDGAWYPDMDNDGTHPTALGAKVLAGQVLVDFPEILQ